MIEQWIRIRDDLFTDPHVLQLADILGEDPLLIVGRLAALWAWADVHTVDGRIGGYREEDVTEQRYIRSAEGTPEKRGVTLEKRGVTAVVDAAAKKDGFAHALWRVGWLKYTDGGGELTDFAEANGATAKKRYLTLQRVRKHRVAVTPERYSGVSQALHERNQEGEVEGDRSSTSAFDSDESKPLVVAPQKKSAARKRASPEPLTYIPPAWVDPEAWAAFVESRRTMRKPLTNFAAKRNVAKLEAIQRDGYDANEALADCAANGWQGPVHPADRGQRSNHPRGGDGPSLAEILETAQ